MTTTTHETTAAAPGGVVGLIRRFNAAVGLIPYDLVALAARVFPAVIFWQSGRTKVDGFAIKDSTWFLFQDLYALPLIPPAWAAVMATVAEHLFPVLLVLGFLSRLSALALLAMTAVIQIFVFPEAWVTHGLWAAALLVVAAQGPGRLSLDHVMRLDRGPRKTS
jgi:putative oxidoreductase